MKSYAMIKSPLTGNKLAIAVEEIVLIGESKVGEKTDLMIQCKSGAAVTVHNMTIQEFAQNCMQAANQFSHPLLTEFTMAGDDGPTWTGANGARVE